MATIGSLAVNVVANTEKFSRGLNKARKETSLFATGLGKITGLASGLGATIAAGFTIRGLQQTANEIDNIAKAADRLGVSTESISGLAHAAEISGSSLEGVVKGLTLLQKNLGQGEAITVEAVKKLGLGISQLENMQADEAMIAIAEAMDKLPNPAQKTAVAMQLFGRSGANLMPLFAEGAAGIRELVQEADDLGLTFSREMGARVEEANDAMTRFWNSIKGLGRELAIALAPAIEKVAKGLADLIALKDAVAIAGETKGGRSSIYEAALGKLTDQELQKFTSGFRKAQADFGAGRGGPISSFVQGQLGIAANQFDYATFETALRERTDKVVEQFAKRHQEQGIADPMGDARKRFEEFKQVQGMFNVSAWMTAGGGGAMGRMITDETVTRHREELKREAESLTQSMLTPLQRTQEQLDRGTMLFREGLIDQATLGALVGARDDARKAAMEEANRRAPELEALVGGTREAFRAARENLRPKAGKDPNKDTADNTKKANDYLRKMTDGITQLATGNFLGAAQVVGGSVG